MGPFFKSLFSNETVFARSVKLIFSAASVALIGFARVATDGHAQWMTAAAGVLMGIQAFIPTGDKTPENVKQLANEIAPKVVQ